MLIPDQSIPDEEEFPAFVEGDPFAEETAEPDPYAEEVLTGDLLPAESTLLCNVASVVDMDRDEALATHKQILQGKEMIKFLLLQMKKRKGWKALSYKSWEEYLAKEFDKTDRVTCWYWLTHAEIQLRISGKNLLEVLTNENKFASLVPITQQQAVILSKLPEELQVSVYTEAKEIALTTTYKGQASIHNGKLTAALLTEIVEAKLKAQGIEPKKAAPQKEPQSVAKQLEIWAASVQEVPEAQAQSEEANEAVLPTSRPVGTPSPQTAPLAWDRSRYMRYRHDGLRVEGERLIVLTPCDDGEGNLMAIIVPLSDLPGAQTSKEEDAAPINGVQFLRGTYHKDKGILVLALNAFGKITTVNLTEEQLKQSGYPAVIEQQG